MSDHIRIRRLDGVWSVRSGGAILGESRNALELTEGDMPPVVYFPRDDVAMAFFDRADKITHCPHKGDACHFTIVNRSSRLENAVWSYEAPVDAMAVIKGHLAFYPDDAVTVERI
jgi:uncharacterized protein (DUF427 family)